MAGLDNLVRLKKSDVPRAAAVLGRAFADEILAAYFFPEEKRLAVAETFSALSLYLCVKYGEVYTTSEHFEGVAAWSAPGTAPFNTWQSLQAVPLSIYIRFALAGGSRLSSLGAYIDDMHRKLAPFPHWYLQIIGVYPAHQGKGFSSRLIKPMLERIDKEGLPCYLETQTDKNVAIYEHLGFEVLHDELLPGTQLPVRCMLRKPGGSKV